MASLLPSGYQEMLDTLRLTSQGSLKTDSVFADHVDPYGEVTRGSDVAQAELVPARANV